LIKFFVTVLLLFSPLLVFAGVERVDSCDPKKNIFSSWKNCQGKMKKKGVDVTSSYTANPLANVSGGLTRGFAYTGSYGIFATFDLEKMARCKGLEFYVAFGWRAGSNLANKTGNQFPPAQVYGNQTWWLNQVYLQQTLCSGKFKAKAGRIESGDDFLQSPLYYYYVSNAFDGNPIGVFFNGKFSAYPNSQWGAFCQYEFTKNLTAKLAFYGTNPYTATDHGFNWRYKGEQGTLLISEWWLKLNQEPHDCGLPGNYKFAVYYYSGDFDQFVGVESRGNRGCYFTADQMIYRPGGPDSDRGLSPWVAMIYTPKDRNMFPFFLATGMVYKGMFACRCKDVTAFAYAYGRYSRCLRAAESHAKWVGMPGPYGDRPQTYEMLLEVNHLFYVNKSFYIQPCVQYIINPKGFGDIDDSLVLGGQFAITF
jgi:porin